MSIFNIMNECGHVIKIEELLSFLGVVATVDSVITVTHRAMSMKRERVE